MEVTGKNGGSFGIDCNVVEETAGGPGGARRLCHSGLLARVSGGQETAKPPAYATENGRNVNRDPSLPPAKIMLDLAERLLPGQLIDTCVISGVCGGLNGFSESTGLEEQLEEGGHGERGDGSTETSPAAALLDQDQQVQHIAAESRGECLVEEGSVRAFAPLDRPACARMHPGCIAVNMSNGVADCPGEVSADCEPFLGHGHASEPWELRVANGGLHLLGNSPGSGLSLSGHPLPPASGEDAPFASELLGLCKPPLSLEPCDKIPSPSPSTLSDPYSDSPLSEPPIPGEEEEEDGEPAYLRAPIRPQSLRTNLNLAVSLSCDATPLSPEEDGGFYFENEVSEEYLRNVLEGGRRQSAPDNLPDRSEQGAGTEQKLLPKRFGIADFFTRSLFSKKSKDPKAVSHNASGWRLFGKTAAREGDQSKDLCSTATMQQQEEEDDSPGSQRPLAAGRRKNLDFEPLSTTALILEDRPSNLPAKSTEETQRHKLEYEEMVAGAKRREMKEAQRKKRQMKERHRQEDSISNAMVVWNTEILPHWDSMKATRRVRELWWQGLPPSVRGRVWSLAIGNELNITPELYEIFLSRAKEKWRSYSETSSVNDGESDGGASLADRESSLDLIKLDISRTFPSLFIFQKGGPYHDLLHSVLGAYTCYRPDIGYVQGMSFIAAVLILNLEEAEAFITFANLLNKPCQMAFFRVDHDLMLKYFAAFEIFFEENLPRLFGHFQTSSLTPDLYLIDWIFTLYSKSLPLDVACRVWDVFCRDGEESLFRTGLGILRLYEEVLLQMDFIHIAQFLSRLPDDLQAHTLFSAMANTHMISRNRRWAQVFSALMKDGNKEAEKGGSPALRS
ncbi:TBC1 domain family member 12 isoform X1 [Oryzias latipes]|uniref:Rab-GAP TBC domain-containing protein n=1 Tax=Oryzias latipes TaxID=8090 RepID=H2L9L6_ORYLA|nr:TBC1 domain family member 12 isoform X1 [Oryzias latipes]